ncbi:MAG TPA: sigma 54-interacting transcriptional regulator [Thermoanaerobaculia bacterium]|nr:sigma 54-interacting transcriptional regulator [Thermoanaerobaculia bacterium]
MAATNASPYPALDELLAASPALLAALGGLRQAAPLDSPVLLLGEPGSGRSTLARALHRASGRGGALVEVDPGTVPATLFESELFGYRAGAFTGATADLEGRVARAERGTLVLDQVEEIPLAAQPKLLRLLAERRYRPLGGDERTAAVRFVALGNESLPRRVRQGLFRGDLYYRLEVLAFRVPPLRERKGEVPALAATLLADLAARLARPAPAITPNALGWMSEHAWPGNLRELRNVLERALVLGDGGPLDPQPPAAFAGARPRTLAEVEREEIVKALAHTRGHQGKAAALLGISRKALWEKRKRFGIP